MNFFDIEPELSFSKNGSNMQVKWCSALHCAMKVKRANKNMKSKSVKVQIL
jgi:hypothetical protein